jgi:hypothetical protein
MARERLIAATGCSAASREAEGKKARKAEREPRPCFEPRCEEGSGLGEKDALEARSVLMSSLRLSCEVL